MIGSEMEVVVIDGQGGGIGRSVIEALKKEVSGTFIIAVGTNSTATNNMKKGGADAVATGENAIIYNAKNDQLVLFLLTRCMVKFHQQWRQQSAVVKLKNILFQLVNALDMS